MHSSDDLIARLACALRCLPGVGPKSAQRMTFYLLERDRESAQYLAQVLSLAIEKGHCPQCGTLTDADLCTICSDRSRDRSLLCVTEYPTDLSAIEQNTDYRGLYIVLMGNLSPLDGIGPRELRLDVLEKRLDEGEVVEIILATSFTVEGETTAHYLSEMAKTRGIQ